MSVEQSKVVVGYDFTRSAREALYRAISLARGAPFHVLHFVCAVEPHGQIPGLPHHGRVDYPYVERVEQAMLDEIAAELKCASIVDRIQFFVHVRIGHAAEEILGLARDIGADLIILGSEGRTGVGRLVLGSVSEEVVRKAGCTVEVARSKVYEYVPQVAVTEATEHRRYTPPHRYVYDSRCVDLRPDEWPLY